MQNIRELMTAKQVAEMFGYSQSSLLNSFDRTAKAIKKKYNVDLIKSKKAGSNKQYFQIFENSRALTIYEEEGDIPLTIENLSFEAYQFFIFLALSASSQGVFRGHREDLLKYVELKPTKRNIEILNDAIQSLVKKDCIGKTEDGKFIILYLKEKIEEQYYISIKMMRECKRIADQNHKNTKKLSQLMRVWQAIRICEANQPFTYADIAEKTKLSYGQIRDVKRLLEQNDMFITHRAGSYFKCLGMNVELNGFYQSDG